MNNKTLTLMLSSLALACWLGASTKTVTDIEGFPKNALRGAIEASYADGAWRLHYHETTNVQLTVTANTLKAAVETLESAGATLDASAAELTTFAEAVEAFKTSLQEDAQ